MGTMAGLGTHDTVDTRCEKAQDGTCMASRPSTDRTYEVYDTNQRPCVAVMGKSLLTPPVHLDACLICVVRTTYILSFVWFNRRKAAGQVRGDSRSIAWV